MKKKKGVLKNFARFTGQHPCQSRFLIKLQNLVADIIFGITQKLLYITLSNLVR